MRGKWELGLLNVDELLGDKNDKRVKIFISYASEHVEVRSPQEKKSIAIIKNMGNCEEELPKKPVGRLSAVCWPTVGRLLADCRPTVGRLSADRRPTGFPQNIDYQSADSRPTNDRQSADSWWCVGKMSVTCR